MHVHPYGTKHAHKHAHYVPSRDGPAEPAAAPGTVCPGSYRERGGFAVTPRGGPCSPGPTPRAVPGPGYPALARVERLISWPPVNAFHSDAYVPSMVSSSS